MNKQDTAKTLTNSQKWRMHSLGHVPGEVVLSTNFYHAGKMINFLQKKKEQKCYYKKKKKTIAQILIFFGAYVVWIEQTAVNMFHLNCFLVIAHKPGCFSGNSSFLHSVIRKPAIIYIVCLAIEITAVPWSRFNSRLTITRLSSV